MPRPRVWTTETVIEHGRPLLVSLVEFERKACGSVMQAYRRVGERIGVKEAWVRHIIGRQPGKGMAAHVLLNICDAYRKLCDRIEAENELERTRMLHILGDLDALSETDDPPLASSRSVPPVGPLAAE